VGPVWRFADLAEFSNMLATLLDRAIPLPQALEVTAQSVRSGAVGEGARQLSAKIAAGHSLASSLETTFPFSPIMSSIANWGERQSSLASAFRVAGVYYEQRQAYQSHLMVIAWPPIVLVLAASLIGYVVIGMMLPLTKLISDLS
jgi:type IV pilus assembly protein PilC